MSPKFRLMCVCVLAGCNSAMGQWVVRPLVRSGDTYPSPTQVVRIAEFGVPSVSRDGKIGVSVRLAGPGVTPDNDTAVIRIDAPGLIFPIVREGDQAPGAAPAQVFGGSGFVFGQAPFTDIVTGIAGELAFGATLTGPGVTPTNDTGIWYYDINTGNVAMLLREGGAVALTQYTIASVLVTRPLCPGPPESPQVVTLAGPGITSGNNTALVLGFPVPAGPRLLIQENDPVFGLGGPVFGDFGVGSVMSHSLGGPLVSMNTILRGPGVGPGNDNAVFAGHYVAGQVPPVPMLAREGDPAPVPIPGAVHGGLFTPPATADPEFAVFRGQLSGPGIGVGNDEVVWYALTQSGLLAPFALEGMTVASHPTLRHAGAFGFPVVTVGGMAVVSGDVVGQGVIQGVNDRALFRGSGPLAEVAVRSGETLRGLAGGERISGTFYAPAITPTQWISTLAKLTGPSIVTGVNDEAMVVYWPNRFSSLAMRTGYGLRAGVVSEIAFADGYGNGAGGFDGRPHMIDDAGHLIMRLTFTNGESGIYRAVPCYANCTNDLNAFNADIFQFLCYSNEFAMGSAYACNCDMSTGINVCDVWDFLCFFNHFANGCP